MIPASHDVSTGKPPWLGIIRRLRLLSAIGIASVIAGILVQAFGRGMGPKVSAAIVDGMISTVPLVWVPLATLLVCVAWTYLVVGALHAPSWLRLLLTAAWLILTFPVVKVATLAWIGYLLVPVLLHFRRWARPLVDFGLWECLVLGIACSIPFIAAGIVSLFDPRSPLLPYVLALSTHFLLLTGVAMPLLILAGTDLAEVASRSGLWVADRLGAWHTRTVAWVLLSLCFLKSGYFLVDGVSLSPGFLLTLLGMAGLVVAGRWMPDSEWLLEPPFALLAGVVALAMAAPVGGVLLAPFLPRPLAENLAGVGFVGSALVVGVAAVMLRPWINRTWPRAWMALAVMGIWLAWLVAGGQVTAWGPTSRGIELGAAAGFGAIAVRALWRKDAPRPILTLGLETLVVLSVISAIQAAYNADLDMGDIFAAAQAALVIGSGVWLWLRHQRGNVAAAVAGAVLGGGSLLVALYPGAFQVAQLYLKLVLMAVALLWEIAVNFRQASKLESDRPPGVHRIFLHIGFSVALVAMLGWYRVLEPSPEQLTEFDPLPAFGMIAVGLPFYLMSVTARLRQIR